MLKKVNSDERGRALLLVLVVLCLGALLIPTFLSHSSTNLLATQSTEKGLKEQYAADAGVEDALLHLMQQLLEVPEFTINGKTVNVSIEELDAWQVFKITSTATSDDESSTTIVSYVYVPLDYSWFFDYAATSPGSVTLKNKSVVTGGIRSLNEPSGQGTYDFRVEDPVNDWPDDLSAFYREQVGDPDGDTTIDISDGTLENPHPIEPLYVDGKLTITGGGVMRLDGTIYVTGDIEVKNSCTIILNGQTIYAEGDIDFKNGCTFLGSGCIIAVGKVDFKTNGDTDPDGFIFVMSINDYVVLHNANSIYGAVAGEVELKEGANLKWTEPPDDLNLPDDSSKPAILTYNINP